MEQGISTKKPDTQAAGDGHALHGRRSPAVGRGRKAPEQSSRGDGRSPRKTGEEVGAREQGHLSPGVGTPLADTDKQHPLTLDQGGLEYSEANGGDIRGPTMYRDCVDGRRRGPSF